MKKILIVEDEQDIRTMICADVKAAGYEVFEAGDGTSALKMAQEIKPDLIITDVLMPQMNGNELIKKVRAAPWGAQIPFVILTARMLMRDYFDMMGIDEFVDKPFVADQILEKIKKILAKQDNLKTLEKMDDTLNIQSKPAPSASRKGGSYDDIQVKEKYCDRCQKTIPYSVEVCPNCGSAHIRVKEGK